MNRSALLLLHRVRRATVLVVRASLVLVVVIMLIMCHAASSPAVAKSVPLATTVAPVEILSEPALDAMVLGELSTGIDLELTGAAQPGFLQVYYADGVGWVPAQYLAVGPRPGIDTAVATVDLPLLDAPASDAAVLATVPEGDTVLLTGAHLDGYDAAAYGGVGGWVDARGLAR